MTFHILKALVYILLHHLAFPVLQKVIKVSFTHEDWMNTHQHTQTHTSSTSAVHQQMEPLTFEPEHCAPHLAATVVIVAVTQVASLLPELNVWSLFQYQTSETLVSEPSRLAQTK